ncbi:LADA_0C05490g1_1 [Lachancea dasiensis]|uniref:LADA_0C05490g1_1 n=1 Tax=Lachancea dasiensis TaxID=1072105 RepID=A0A1G4IYZ9_9SACH|nr:LADA_0C05490g1_1 [Lachancea dasiensis]
MDLDSESSVDNVDSSDDNTSGESSTLPSFEEDSQSEDSDQSTSTEDQSFALSEDSDRTFEGFSDLPDTGVISTDNLKVVRSHDSNEEDRQHSLECLDRAVSEDVENKAPASLSDASVSPQLLNHFQNPPSGASSGSSSTSTTVSSNDGQKINCETTSVLQTTDNDHLKTLENVAAYELSSSSDNESSRSSESDDYESPIIPNALSRRRVRTRLSRKGRQGRIRR